MDSSSLALGDFLGHDFRDGHHHGCLLGLCHLEFRRILELGPGRKCSVCALVDLGCGDSYHDYLQEKCYSPKDLHHLGHSQLYLGIVRYLLGSFGGIG